MIGGWVLDACTLASFAREQPYPQALVWAAVEEGMVLAVPSAALAVAWARLPTEAHDALSVLLDLPQTVVDALDAESSAVVGTILATAGQPTAVSPGHVIHTATRRGWPVATGEADTLRSIAPNLDVDELP